MREVRRLPLPGWITALAIPIFIATWVLAPSETLSGTSRLDSVVLPPRDRAAAPPILQIHRPSGQPPPRTIYGLERTWRVALTFDDGPHPVHTKRLLDILDRHQVKATFFINGYWVDEKRRSSARRLRRMLVRAQEAGHTIGNHTYGHALLSRLAPDDQEWQIAENHRMIESITGQPPMLFRPPYAVMTRRAHRVARDLGYTIARWSATAPDEEIRDPEELRRTVISWLKTYNGGIIMLHDRHRWSVEAADLILRFLERDNCRRLRRGRPTFQVVSLDSFLRPPPQSGAPHVEVERQRHLARLRRVCSAP